MLTRNSSLRVLVFWGLFMTREYISRVVLMISCQVLDRFHLVGDSVYTPDTKIMAHYKDNASGKDHIISTFPVTVW